MILKDTKVKTRKAHYCEDCGWVIPKGYICRYVVAIVNCQFTHGWFHIHHNSEFEDYLT